MIGKVRKIKLQKLLEQSMTVDNVNFKNIKTAFAILKRSKAMSVEEIAGENEEQSASPALLPAIKELYDMVEPITAEEIVALDNIEERMVAMRHYGFENFVKNFDNEIVDSQTLVKHNIRWKVNNNGELISYKDVINDKYELIKLKIPIKSRQNSDVNEYVIAGVRCKCTTTGKEYFIQVDPKNTNAIEAIASTMYIKVKPEAVDYFIRQGDVPLVKVKPEYENNWKCDPRPMTKSEYLEKLTCES